MQPYLEGQMPATGRYDYTEGHPNAGDNVNIHADPATEAQTRQEVDNFGSEATNGHEFSLITRKLLAANELPEEEREAIADALGIPLDALAHYAATAYRNRDRIVELEDENAELREANMIDKESGCYSKAAFMQIFEEFCGRAVMNNVPLILMYADMRDLKKVNDNSPRAHDTGDEYISDTGARTRQFFHSKAKAIRVGGDEVVIIGVIEQPGIADGYDDPEHTEGVYTEIESAFRQYVNDGIRNNPILNHDLPPELRKEVGMKELGVDVGGVFVLPEDLLEIAQEVVLEERSIEGVAKRIRSVADTLMYNDKDNTPTPPELGHRFYYNDLFTRTSRFKLRDPKRKAA